MLTLIHYNQMRSLYFAAESNHIKPVSHVITIHSSGLPSLLLTSSDWLLEVVVFIFQTLIWLSELFRFCLLTLFVTCLFLQIKFHSFLSLSFWNSAHFLENKCIFIYVLLILPNFRKQSIKHESWMFSCRIYCHLWRWLQCFCWYGLAGKVKETAEQTKGVR